MIIQNMHLVIILGMHRSGTSTCSRLTNLAGIDLGDQLMAADSDNPKGFFEDLDVVSLNDRILEASGARWYTASVCEIGLNDPISSSFQPAIRALLEERFASRTRYGVKDPRLCRTLPLWQAVLDDAGIAVTYILVHRNPLEVANSLNRRNRFSREHVFRMWFRYNLEALLYTQASPRLILAFDDLVGRPDVAVDKIARFVDPDHPHPEAALHAATEFVDRGLRHAHHTDEDLERQCSDPGVIKLYTALRQGQIAAPLLEELSGHNATRLMSETHPWTYRALSYLHHLIPLKQPRHGARHWLHR